MRKTLVFLLVLCTKLTFAQLSDNFDDGDFTSNPVWGGNTSNFSINASGQLQSNGPNLANQNISLSTSNFCANNAVWEFFIQLNFDPTTTNYPRVYLISNQADLSRALQGYFFQIGETGQTDRFRLYRQNGTSTTQIITGPAKVRTNANLVTARIKITRDDDGKWELYADVAGGTNYVLEGTATDNTYTTTTHFGVNCRYATASRYNQFIFDDFKITELIPDVTPPKILSIKSLNTKTIELTFDEALENISAQNVLNYSLSRGAGNPLAATMGAANNVVNLTYANDFISGEYTLTTSNIADAKGNRMTAAVAKTFVYVEPYIAKRGDVVFSEIMAAPISTAAALNKEYFELFNTTNKYIIITGWKYKDASTSIATFAADTLAPKSYRIVCAIPDVDQYKVYGKTLGISPWPVLNNDRDDLSLFLPDGATVIDFVSYADTWYRDQTKKTGYALELINPNGPCGGAFNWTASTASNGGTPGLQNSVYDPLNVDNVAPKLVMATILSPTEIQLEFDKAIATEMLTDVDNYHINNGIGKPLSVELIGTLSQRVKLIFSSTNAITNNVEALLTVTNLANCNGVPIDAAANTALILITDTIKAGDILISEVLFNPKTGGADFVEVYNQTNKILDLKELNISNPAASSITGASKRAVSETTVLIRPKTYWVLTANPEIIKQHYGVKHQSQMVQVASMPAFNNDKGTVSIWKGEELIDELAYTDKMHHELLREVKGVSLERVSFNKSGNDIGNLQSAAAVVGFATPTYENSQRLLKDAANIVEISNKTFSPDNDGFEDALEINYRFSESGNLTTINIFTDKGVLVRRLIRNNALPVQGTIYWDGLNDAGQLCKVGLYVLQIEVFNTSGKTRKFKQTCILAAKLN